MFSRRVRIGLGLLAVVVAVGAIPAGAQASYFLGGGFPLTLTGSQVAGEKHVITIEGNKVECTTASFSGTYWGESAFQSLTPSYSGCKAFGFLEASVTNEGCEYSFSTGFTIESTGRYDGDLSLVCGFEDFIKVTAATCEVRFGDETTGHVGANALLSTVEYTNMAGSPGDLTANTKLTGINADKTKDGFLCPLNGTGEVNNVTYTGNTTITAKTSGGEARGIIVEE